MFVAAAGEARHSLRAVRRAPTFVLSTAIVLGAGFGLCGVVLSILGAVMGSVPPVRDPDHVVSLIHSSTMIGPQPLVSYADYLDVVETPQFRDAAAYSPIRVVATMGARRGLVVCEVVSDNYFEVLGIAPAVGRVWSPRDTETTVPVVISDDTWATSFGRRTDVIGRPIPIGSAAGVVVGVAPAGFRGLSAPGLLPARFWVPVSSARLIWPQDPRFTRRELNAFSVKIRLPRGMTIDPAKSVVADLGAALEREYPSVGQPRDFSLSPLTSVWISERTDRAALPMAQGVLALCGLMLLLTTAHAAHLILARGYSRSGELTTRYALGAPRRLLILGLTLETASVTAIAVAIALGVSAMAPGLLDVARLPHVGGAVVDIAPVVDMRVVGGLITAALAVLVLCGFIPALRLTKRSLQGDPRFAMRPCSASGIRVAGPTLLLLPLVTGSMFVLALGGVFFQTLWVSWHASTSFSIRLRQRELAIRRALGATHVDVIATVFKDSSRVIGLGLLAGAILFLPARSALRGFVRGIATHDGATLAVVCAIVATSVIAAGALAIARDLFVEPADILREE